MAAHCGLHAATGQRAYDSICRSLNSTALLAQPCYRLLPGSSVLSLLAPCNGSRFDLWLPLATRSESTQASGHLRRRVRQVCNMSGGIDWGAGQREFAAFCNSSCSPTPSTTAYAPAASCTDNRTPVRSYRVTGGYTVSLTRNVTATACAPTQWIPGCQSCPDIDDTSNISPGVCPEDAPAASTGIVGCVTTHYCCPL